MENCILLLPVLCFLPMICAVISYLIGRRSKTARNTFVCAAVAVEFALSVYMLVRVLSGAAGSIEFPAICGYALRIEIDGFRALYVLITVFMFLMTTLFSPVETIKCPFPLAEEAVNKPVSSTLPTAGSAVQI